MSEQTNNPTAGPFGVGGADSYAKQRVNLLPPVKHPQGGYVFPQVFLASVSFREVTNKDQTKQRLLDFKFKEIVGTREHTHSFWPLKPGAQDFEKDLKTMNFRIDHIMQEALGHKPASAIGTTAKDCDEFLQAVHDYFNTGANGNPIYNPKLIFWFKVVYTKKGELAIPFGNFAQRCVQGARCELGVDLRYDILEQPTEAKKSGSNRGSDAPYGAGYNPASGYETPGGGYAPADTGGGSGFYQPPADNTGDDMPPNV